MQHKSIEALASIGCFINLLIEQRRFYPEYRIGHKGVFFIIGKEQILAITLSQLCYNTEVTYSMQLLAGQAGTSSFVRWVHLVEDIEVPDFLHGNELLFVTGIGQQKYGSLGWLLPFAEKMIEKNAAGLCVNLGPYIPEVPKELIDYCDEHHLPLYSLPWSVHLIDIIYDFCHRIIANEESEISLGTAFRNLIFSPENHKDYVPVLDRRGFHDDGSYTSAAIKLIPNTKAPVGHDYLGLKYLMQKTFSKEARQVSMFTQDETFIMIFYSIEHDYIFEKLSAAADEYVLENPCFDIRVGFSEAGFGYQAVPEIYQQSVSSLKVSQIKSVRFMNYADTGVYRLLLAVTPSETLRSFKNEVIGKLEEFDQKNYTSYCQVLRDYLDNNSSIQVVAAKCNVHRNTVNYQIKRIKEILNSDFNAEDRMSLQLAFYISDLLES